MKPLLLDRIRTIVTRVLQDPPQVAAAYAYGSRISGRVLPMSDLDLALLLVSQPRNEDPLLAERIAARIGDALGTAVDVDAHLVDHLPLPVRGRVVTTGVLLFERDPARRVEFETSTRRLYFDFLPLLERDARTVLLGGG